MPHCASCDTRPTRRRLSLNPSTRGRDLTQARLLRVLARVSHGLSVTLTGDPGGLQTLTIGTASATVRVCDGAVHLYRTATVFEVVPLPKRTRGVEIAERLRDEVVHAEDMAARRVEKARQEALREATRIATAQTEVRRKARAEAEAEARRVTAQARFDALLAERGISTHDVGLTPDDRGRSRLHLSVDMTPDQAAKVLDLLLDLNVLRSYLFLRHPAPVPSTAPVTQEAP